METNNALKITRMLRILYPIWILVGIVSIVIIPSTLFEKGNAEITVHNISAQELLFRLGIAGRIIAQLLFIIIPLLLYRLFEKTNKNQAILMVAFALVSVPITMYNETNQITVLSFLDQPEMVMGYLDSYRNGMIIGMIFWGLWLFPLGRLSYTSTYFPKIIGIFLYIAGVGYMLGSFTELIVPEAATLKSIFEYFTFGELIFALWLIIKGIKIKTSTQ